MKAHHVTTGVELREFRHERRLSTTRIANVLGCSEETVRAKETADAPLSVFQRGAIICAFEHEPTSWSARGLRLVAGAACFGAGFGMGVAL